MTTHLQQTMDELLAQRARIDAALAALQELGGGLVPEPNGTKARGHAPGRKPGPKPAARAKVDGRHSTRDWTKGRQLYDAGKSFPEIAAALGTSVGTIYDARHRFHWPKRTGGKKNGLKGKAPAA